MVTGGHKKILHKFCFICWQFHIFSCYFKIQSNWSYLLKRLLIRKASWTIESTFMIFSCKPVSPNNFQHALNYPTKVSFGISCGGFNMPTTNNIVYSIQHYEIKFVSDLRQLWFSPPIKLTAMT